MSTVVPEGYLGPDVLNEPGPYFRHLQEEDPVHRSAWLRSWVVTRYADVKQLLTENEILSANTVAPARELLSAAQMTERKATFEVLSRWLPFIDPPDHLRLRSLINRSFTPRQVRSLQPKIESTAHQILDELEGDETVEIVEGFSHRLTVSTICGMLGVPEADREQILGWASGIQALVHVARNSKDRRTTAEQAFNELIPYFERLVADRRAHPQDDLITAMTTASKGDRVLSTEEIVATSILFIFAGQETSTSLVAATILGLLQNPDQLLMVRQDVSLAPQAVEESLRYWGIAWSITRVAKQDFDFSGRSIKSGDQLLLALGAANRDPRKFDHPERFDLRRPQDLHLAFGGSIHYCLGAPLARLQDEVALRVILERCPHLALDESSEVRWLPQLITRQIEALYVTGASSGGCEMRSVC